MKSIIKSLLTAIGLLLITVGVVAVFVLGQAQDVLTKSMEELIADAFGSTASVEAIAVAPLKRSLVLKNFRLTNPDEFSEGDAFTCDRIELRILPESLLERIPIIESVLIEQAHINYVYKLGHGTNVGRLAKNLADLPTRGTTTFKVERLTCTDAKLHLSANFMPNKGIALNMVTVDLKDLDNGSAITGAQTMSIFLRSAIRETITLKGLLKPAGDNLRKEVDAID